MGEQEMIQEIIQESSKAPVEAPIQASPGMLDTIKEKLHVGDMVEKVKHSKDKLIEVGLYAGIGFIFGFLLKKYSTYVLVCVLVLIGLGVLQHLEVINVLVNWDKVNELFGIQAAQTVTADGVVSMLWESIKLNMWISISCAVGLFIGLRIG